MTTRASDVDPFQATTERPSTRRADSGGRAARGIAYDGGTVKVPDMPPLPQWHQPTTEDERYVPDEEYDASELSDVNRELNRCKARMFRMGNMLAEAETRHAEAALIYDRHLRRALLSVSGGSAETRKATAELQCEPYENDVAVSRQVVETLKRKLQAVRAELDAVTSQSHNVRAQVNLR